MFTTPLSLRRLGAGLFAVLLFSLTPCLHAAEPLRYPVTIAGHTYDAVLFENKRLFDRVKSNAEGGTAKHYYGSIEGLDGSWLRLSEVNGRVEGFVSVFGENYMISEAAVLLPSAVANASLASVPEALSTQSASVLGELGQCGVDDSHSPTSSPESFSAAQSATFLPSRATFDSFCTSTLSDGVNDICLVAELEFAFDAAFVASFDNEAEAVSAAESIINFAEAFFVEDLGVAFETIAMTFLGIDAADPFTASTDPSVLINDIGINIATQNVPFLASQASLFHLVTGRDFIGGTVGIAFGAGPEAPGSGALCSIAPVNTGSAFDPDGDGPGGFQSFPVLAGNALGMGAGTSQLLSSSEVGPLQGTAIIVAHELGHNFGSNHDSGDDGVVGEILPPASGSTIAEANPCTAGEFIMTATFGAGAASNALANGFSSSVEEGESDPCSVEQMSSEISSVLDGNAVVIPSAPSAPPVDFGQCFDFPVQLSLVPSSANPTVVSVGESATFSFTLSGEVSALADGFAGASIEVEITNGVISSIASGSAALTPAPASSSVGVALATVASSFSLPAGFDGTATPISLTVVPDGGDFDLTVTVEGGEDLGDIDPSDNLGLSLALAESVVGSVPAPTPAPSGGGGGGGPVAPLTLALLGLLWFRQRMLGR